MISKLSKSHCLRRNDARVRLVPNLDGHHDDPLDLLLHLHDPLDVLGLRAAVNGNPQDQLQHPTNVPTISVYDLT